MAKPKLLLHVCCAPCSTHVINVLRDEYEVEAFFYNPNIHPEEEYRLRIEESRAYCKRIGLPLHSVDYDTQEWFKRIAGHEGDEEGGARCRICYRLRLEKTAEKAARDGFQYFTTTLTISPHKDAKVINAIGRELARQHGVSFLEADFKKKDGFKQSVELSRKYGMRRQNYCGCVYSLRSS
jgi:predicted adenine nucleotide alpha hydrolase (AANH) superfamily ATPase